MTLKQIFKPAVLAAALCLGGVGSVFAAPIVTIEASSTQGGGNTAATFGAGYDATLPSGATWSPDVDPTVSSGNLSGAFQSPFNNTGLLTTQSYFSVGGGEGDNGTDVSPVDLNFSEAQNGFSILWGSIDSYNTLSFLDAMGDVMYAYTGTNIVNLGALGGVAANFEQVALLDFDFGAESFWGVRFTSTQAAFEFALPSEVPEPGMLALLALGLIGVGVARRRQVS